MDKNQNPIKAKVAFDEIQSNIIKTEDENGEMQYFELVDVFKCNNKDYAALLRVNEDGSDIESDEEEELVLMRLIEEEDNYTFEEIEDDKEFEEVCDAFENEIDDEDEE